MIAQYKNSESMVIVCRYTGIQAKIDLPKIGNLTLEYTHPLSHIGSALEASDRQDFMRRLDAPVLAGILITLLRHARLLASSKDHAGAVNAQLSKASKAYLIKSIEIVRRNLTHVERANFLPKVVFDYYESQAEANRALEAAIGSLMGELLNDTKVTEQVRNYFRAHSKATTFEGYTRQQALERAREIDDLKAEARKAELAHLADKALAKLERQRKAKEGMLSKRERAQKLRIVVRTETSLTPKQTRVLTTACKQAEILPEAQLTKLSARVDELLEEYGNDELTCSVLFAAQAIFTHYIKEFGQNPFSVEDELLGDAAVHTTPAPETTPAETTATEARKPSLLERIRAKRATSN